MSASDRVRHQDISALLKLANELHELAPNPVVRQEHMLRSLAKMLGASVGVSLMGRTGPRSAPQRIDLCMLVYCGLDDPDHRRVANEYFRTMLPANPVRRSIVPLSRKVSPATYRREELVDDADWYRSAYYEQRHQPMGLDHSMYSALSFDGSRMMTAMGMYRPAGDRRQFTDRERSLMRMFHSQAQWLYECEPPGDGSPVMVVLSPRQKQTLRLLLGGDAEKQIASKLSLSRHTVHEHVKAIYRSIGVSSRGELLAKFLRKG